MKVYVISGRSAEGNEERREIADSNQEVVEHVIDITTQLVRGWDKFTIEVDAEDR